MSGHYRMARGWMEHEIFRNEAYSERTAWIWLIEQAAWQPTTISIDHMPVVLGRGELSFSERFLASKWKWSRSRVHRFLGQLTTWGMISARHSPVQKSSHQSDHPQNILSICNYDKYQAPRTISEPSIEPSANHLRTIPEPKKKEDKELISSGSKDPSDSSVPEKMVEVWKAELGEVLSVPTKLNAERRRTCKARWRDSFGRDLEQWRGHCRRIRGSPFLCGETDGPRKWRADFDWALKPKSILSVQEGKYGVREIVRAEPSMDTRTAQERRLAIQEAKRQVRADLEARGFWNGISEPGAFQSDEEAAPGDGLRQLH